MSKKTQSIAFPMPLHEKIQQEAKATDRSINYIVVKRLEKIFLKGGFHLKSKKKDPSK